MQERLKEVEQEVSGGATAVVALILNNKLYIANVGMDTHIYTGQSGLDIQRLWQNHYWHVYLILLQNHY